MLDCYIPSYFKDQSDAIMTWIMPEPFVTRPRGSPALGTRLRWSQKATNLLSKCGVGISYSRVTHVCSQIANAMQKNIKTNGVFLPPSIVTGCAIWASADNVDKQHFCDGKNSFHAMASTVFFFSQLVMERVQWNNLTFGRCLLVHLAMFPVPASSSVSAI